MLVNILGLTAIVFIVWCPSVRLAWTFITGFSPSQA